MQSFRAHLIQWNRGASPLGHISVFINQEARLSLVSRVGRIDGIAVPVLELL